MPSPIASIPTVALNVTTLASLKSELCFDDQYAVEWPLLNII